MKFKSKLRPLALAIFSFLFSVFLLLQPSNIFADSCDSETCDPNSDNYGACLAIQRECWENKISTAQREANTLQSTISILDGQIRVQALQIQQTVSEINQLEKEITELSQRIEGLSISLDKLSGILIERIRQSYKQSRTQFKANLFVSDSFNQFISQNRYLSQAQSQTLDVMKKTELQRATYDQQKTLKEEKQAEVAQKRNELQAQKATLDAQKNSKNSLLVETKNNEAVYQQKLARIKSELESINAIILGKGTESEVRDVKEGEKIASVIQGESCNSGGTHLHFSITKNNISQNPFSYLKETAFENCSGSFCGSNDGDSFNPSGSWPWPLNGLIRLSQGYGNTWAVRNTWVSSIYNFHTGIDIVPSDSTSVKAVKDGKLYYGSYTGSYGCKLPYVKVVHSDSVISLYLHVNYF